MELGLQQLFVGKLRLVLSDQGWRQGAAQGVLNHLAVFGRTEQQANRRAFVRLAHVPVECLQVEVLLRAAKSDVF